MRQPRSAAVTCAGPDHAARLSDDLLRHDVDGHALVPIESRYLNYLIAVSFIERPGSHGGLEANLDTARSFNESPATLSSLEQTSRRR